MTRARPFSRSALPAWLEHVSANAAARWPRAAYLMTSDVAWQLPGSAPKENVRLWSDDAGLAGWGWFQPTATLLFDVRADLAGADWPAREILGWAEEMRRGFAPGYPFYLDVGSMAEWEQALLNPQPPSGDEGLVLVTSALESDRARTELLERNGYETKGHFAYCFARSLDQWIPDPALPPGAMLRHVTEDDLAERVATHRDSWPGSTFDLDRYRRVRGAPVFAPELDVVLEAGDGSFASYCIAWADAASGIGSFEPVGTRPAWRGRGVAREVIHEGFRRMREGGMHAAIVGTAGFNDSAAALYRSCGFEQIDVERTFAKKLDG